MTEVDKVIFAMDFLWKEKVLENETILNYITHIFIDLIFDTSTTRKSVGFGS